MTTDEVLALVNKVQALALIRPDIAVLVIELVDRFLELTTPPDSGNGADVKDVPHVPRHQ